MKGKYLTAGLAVIAAASVARIWLAPGALWWRLLIAGVAVAALVISLLPRRSGQQS